MRIPLYQVDAFSTKLFSGNPAAVCPLDEWLDDDVLQGIAAENNLSETAFFVAQNGGYELRWFTPVAEVDLCGHATLASAWVILNVLKPSQEAVSFDSRSGTLSVQRGENGLLVLDFPSKPASSQEAPKALIEGLGAEPVEVLAAERDYLVVFETEDAVRKLKPDFLRLRTIDRLGIIVTAPGLSSDFVSRFFSPALLDGFPEDPVTGSAHCTLIPFWAERLNFGDNWMDARQISARGGRLACQYLGDRVAIGGEAVLYLTGSIEL